MHDPHKATIQQLDTSWRTLASWVKLYVLNKLQYATFEMACRWASNYISMKTNIYNDVHRLRFV
jgi:hypothetical protein